MAVNEAFLATTMTEAPAILGRGLFDIFPDNPAEPDLPAVRNLRASLEKVAQLGCADKMPVQLYPIRGPDGRFKERWWSMVNAPVYPANGDPMLIIHRAEDVTPIVRMRSDAEAADQRARDRQAFIDRLHEADATLRRSEERYRTLFESIDQGFSVVEVLFEEDGHAGDFRFLAVNPAFSRSTGLTDPVGETMRGLYPQFEQAWIDAYGRVATTGQPEHFEAEVAQRGRWFDVYAFRVDDPALRHVAILFNDVSERKRAELHQATLLAELQHRVRNTLAVLRSIARRTAENSTTVEEMSAHLQGRIAAFSRVQSAVTREPGRGVSLALLIAEEMIAHSIDEGERLSIGGPTVCLGTRPAESISLAIHELATNAVKYGALSSPHGRISVRWEERERDGTTWLGFRWIERGLDAPLSPPERRGFGMELFERSLAYDLGAQVAVRFPPEGLEFEMTVPKARVEAPA